MARLPRLAVAGEAHLVIQPGLAGTPVFRDGQDRNLYMQVLREALVHDGVQLHACALLPREVLLLLRPRETAGLSRLMQAVGRRYVSAYNRRHARRGPLWSGRFRCSVLAPGAPVLEALAWVELQRAAGEPDGEAPVGQHDGPSEAPAHAWPARHAMAVDPPELWALGNTPFERESAYRLLLQRGIAAEAGARLRAAAMGGWAYGLPPAAARRASGAADEGAPPWARALDRPVQPRAKGRPRRPG
jgi:putative transposase